MLVVAMTFRLQSEMVDFAAHTAILAAVIELAILDLAG